MGWLAQLHTVLTGLSPLTYPSGDVNEHQLGEGDEPANVGQGDGNVLHVLREQDDEEDHGQAQLGTLANVGKSGGI